MCGICGLVGFQDQTLLRQMTALLRHRGPDDEGFFFGNQVGLGHRRLSIIDLQTGQQPIFNEDRSVCIVFNGEIYNYQELKRKLEKRGHTFRTATDTEVIVHAYEDLGERCVEELNGEFAIAIWDEKAQCLFLARDRLGIRPIYYCLVEDKLAFSSELKSLLLWEKTPRTLNSIALDGYLTLRYVPASMTLFAGIEKLSPASTLTFQNGQVQIKRYWQVRRPLIANADLKECEDAFYELLKDSVRLRLMSDVPLGAYLSGGIDSSAIVGLMSQMTSMPVKTFTIGGFGAEVDELAKARSIAQYFKTDHHELVVNKQDFDLFPRILQHMDSPIGDAIIIPTFLLAQETSKHVKVVLSGEGADEILAGYVHQLTLKYSEWYRHVVPISVQTVATRAVKLSPPALLNLFFPYPAALGEKGKSRVLRYLETLQHASPAQGFLTLASLFSAEERSLLYSRDYQQALGKKDFLTQRMDVALGSNGGFLNSLVVYDMENWLPDNTLIKQDHLGLANSLEARVPFLDHRLVEFCAGLPEDFKIRGLTQKYLLRRAVSRLLPPATVNAPKRAFYIPTEKCFGDDFDQYVRDTLCGERLRARGIFNVQYLESRLNTARSTELVNNKQVMALLILELWFRTFVDGEGLRRGLAQ